MEDRRDLQNGKDSIDSDSRTDIDPIQLARLEIDKLQNNRFSNLSERACAVVIEEIHERLMSLAGRLDVLGIKERGLVNEEVNPSNSVHLISRSKNHAAESITIRALDNITVSFEALDITQETNLLERLSQTCENETLAHAFGGLALNLKKTDIYDRSFLLSYDRPWVERRLEFAADDSGQILAFSLGCKDAFNVTYDLDQRRVHIKDTNQESQQRGLSRLDIAYLLHQCNSLLEHAEAMLE